MRRPRYPRPYHACRLGIVVCMLGLGFVAVLARLYVVQVAQHTALQTQAAPQHSRMVKLHPERGRVFDRRGRVLATSVFVPSVYARPRELEHPQKAAQHLARILGLSAATVQQRVTERAPFVWLARQVPPEVADQVQALKLRGVGVITEARRYYPKRHLAGQVLGFVGVDGKGLGGLEYHYNRDLTATARHLILPRDARGRWSQPVDTGVVAHPRGADLYVTLDERLQQIAEKEIASQVKQVGAKSGVVVMMQPQTGDILAMAAYPFFDPNVFHNPSQRVWQRNRSVTDPVEPGSTFKLVMAAAALEEQTVRPGERFFCENGELLRGRRRIRDYKPYDVLNFTEILAYSSNIGAIKVNERLRPTQFYDYMRRFGFGEKSQVDLPGEDAGQVRHPRRWSRFSHDSLTLGQEITVTPLQLATAFAAVANGGWLMQPRIVQRIAGRDAIQDIPVQARRRILSQRTTGQLTAMLTQVVASGTGSPAAIEGYAVAGKTGTAQKVDAARGGYSHTKVLASFVGYVPAEDPQVVILVMVDEPKRQRWGSLAAAPVFRRIAQQAMHYLQIPPREVRPRSFSTRDSAKAGNGTLTGDTPLHLKRRSARRRSAHRG